MTVLGWTSRREKELATEKDALADGLRKATEEVAVLMAERERLLEILASRNDLVANVSHELKTPLTAIRGCAETLRDGALDKPDVGRRFVERILEQSRRLEDLLRDLLTLSRLEGDDRPDRREIFDIAEIAEHTFEVMAPRAEARQIELHRAAAGPTVHVEGNQGDLERLLLNLVENAIKYNRSGGRVEVRWHAQGSDAVLEVADDGIGIPADDLEHIFQRFYRVDKGRARREGGTGLGLAIVKHVARCHGGRVEVASRLGEGSTFSVRLPLGTRDE